VVGRWLSRVMPLAIGLEGLMVAVYSQDWRGLLREGEIERECSMRQHLWDEARSQRQAELEQLDRLHAEELTQQETALTGLRRCLEELERGE
jgi:hypothetical protein